MNNNEKPVTNQQLIAALTEFEQRIEKRMTDRLAESEQRMIGRQDRAVEAMSANLSELRTEMVQRIDGLERSLGLRIDGLERRFDTIASVVLSVDARMGALTRWADTSEKSHAQLTAAQAAQQRAIDQLSQRIAKLEQQKSN